MLFSFQAFVKNNILQEETMSEVATIFKTNGNKLVCIPPADTDEKPVMWQSIQMLVAHLLQWGNGPEKKFCFGEHSKNVEVGDSLFETVVLEPHEKQEILKEIDVARGAFTRG